MAGANNYPVWLNIRSYRLGLEVLDLTLSSCCKRWRNLSTRSNRPTLKLGFCITPFEVFSMRGSGRGTVVDVLAAALTPWD